MVKVKWTSQGYMYIYLHGFVVLFQGRRCLRIKIKSTPSKLSLACLIYLIILVVVACFSPVINIFFFFPPSLWFESLSFKSPCGVFTQKIIQPIVAQQLMRLVVKWMTQRLQGRGGGKKKLSVSGEYHSVPERTHTHTHKHTKQTHSQRQRDSGLPCTPHRYPSAPSPPRRHHEMQNKG